MKIPESIIEKIVEEEPAGIKTMATVTGKGYYPAPITYRNTKTGEEYAHIAGAIGWPEKINPALDNRPGFAVVVGVEKTNDAEPKFYVLDWAQSHDVNKLLQACIEMAFRWGCRESDKILHGWFGDHERYQEAVYEVNRQFEKSTGYGGIYIEAPAPYGSPDPQDVYGRKLRDFLDPNQGEKRLVIGQCNEIRTAVQNKEIDSPTFTAIASAVYTLNMRKPWMNKVNDPTHYIEI